MRGALRGASFDAGEGMLAPRSPTIQMKAAGTAVQMDGESDKLAEEILALVQTNYKASPIRVQYEAEVAGLKAEADKLLEGKDKTNDGSIEDVARTMNQRRLDIGKKYKALTILPLRDFILYANSQRYDTEYGPSFEWLKAKGKTNLQVIEGSSRPNPDINSFLAPFGTWLKAQKLSDLQNYKASVSG